MKNLRLAIVALMLLSTHIVCGQITDTTKVKGDVKYVFETKLQNGGKIESKDMRRIFLKLDDKVNSKVSRIEFYGVTFVIAALIILGKRQ